MNEAQWAAYVAVFALGLGGGGTLERFRAATGGFHKMRLVHHESGVSVEREYDDSEPVSAVQDELTGRLQAKLSERGLTWPPAGERG